MNCFQDVPPSSHSTLPIAGFKSVSVDWYGPITMERPMEESLASLVVWHLPSISQVTSYGSQELLEIRAKGG